MSNNIQSYYCDGGSRCNYPYHPVHPINRTVPVFIAPSPPTQPPPPSPPTPPIQPQIIVFSDSPSPTPQPTPPETPPPPFYEPPNISPLPYARRGVTLSNSAMFWVEGEKK
jgi:hypothetical protein